MIQRNLKFLLLFAVFHRLILNTWAESGKVIISKFMAITSATLADEDGEFSD
jgi:hypothetical protein